MCPVVELVNMNIFICENYIFIETTYYHRKNILLNNESLLNLISLSEYLLIYFL